MASSSSAYATREIVFEPNFDFDSFKGGIYCEGGLRILDNNCCRPLFNPPNRAYPRVVREFYETFSVTSYDDDDIDDSFSVTIDGIEFNFDYDLIANALGVPETPIVYKFSLDILIRDLNHRPKLIHDGVKVRVSYMHEDMFLVDQFFSEVLCPGMHHNERPHYTLKYLHGLYKKKKLDVSLLIIDIIDHVRTGGRKNVKPPKLVYPRFITAILEKCGYVFKADEQVVTQFRTLNYQNTRLSLKRLGDAAGISAPEEQNPQRLSSHRRPSESRTAQVSEATAPIVNQQVEDPSYVTRSEFDIYCNNVNTRLDRQEEDMAYLTGQMGEMYFRQEVSMERQWGKDAAEMLTEARTRYDQANAARRARRASRAMRSQEEGPSSRRQE